MKKVKKNRNTSLLTILMYLIAAGMLLAFLISFYDVTTYILELHAAGSISLRESVLDILIYYMNNTLKYFGFATVIFGLGYIINYIQSVKKQTTIENQTTLETEN